MIKKFLLLLLLLPLLLPTSAIASSNFSVSSDTTYTVLDTGLTHVVFSLILSNTSSAYYAESYKLHLGFDHMTNIQVTDSGGAIKPVITKSEKGYILDIPFHKKAVGVGKTQPFTLSFDTTDVAENSGKIWEINIPGIPEDNNFSNFNVHVKVPPSFGKPSYIKPLYDRDSFTDLTFTKDELQKTGISMAFGEKQIYNFSLTYHIKNNNLFPAPSEITIPSSTNYQDVFISAIDPQPKSIRIDDDGNWIAEYRLLPGENKEIIAKGTAELFLYPKKEPHSEKELAKYLVEQPHWEISAAQIKQKTKELKTPSAIYQYVVKTLSYDLTRVTDNKLRLGALGSLQNPSSAVCLEFTDLFIALARANGIPARAVEGYANTKNSKERPLSLVRDILHAWPEYYDRELQTWIMVDPTWGNTTGGVDYFSILDFNHFAFIKRGINSQLPIPAGAYKIAGFENKKDVIIQAVTVSPQKIEKTDMQIQMKKTYTAGLPIEGSVYVKNLGNTQTIPEKAEVTTTVLNPKKQQISIPALPPSGSIHIPLRFESLGFLTNITDTITIQTPGKKTSATILVSPFFLFRIF